jgi:hypothetical protein
MAGRLVEYGFDPSLIVEVPADSFANSTLEGVRRNPAEFALNFRSINCIPPIVTRPVFNEGNQFLRVAAQLRCEFVNQITDQFHDVDIGPLIVAADVVGLCILAASQYLPQRFIVIAHIKPIAHIHAVAINGDGFSCEAALDDHWDQLFGKLVRAVVVRAIRDHHIQSVGVMIRSHKHVA